MNRKSRILLAISKRKACYLLLHLHSLLASSILENCVNIIVGLRDFLSFLSHLGTVLPWYYPKLVCFFTRWYWWLAASHFCSSLLRPFLSELSRQEQGPLSCSDKMAQWSSSGPGQFGFSSSICVPYTWVLARWTPWESWVVEFELISLRDFVTCHLCPFVWVVAGTIIPRDLEHGMSIGQITTFFRSFPINFQDDGINS